MNAIERRLNLARFGHYRSRIALLIMTVAVFALFIIISPSVFLNVRIYRAFLTTVPFIGLMALGLTFVLAMGEIDLSFPSTMALAGFVFTRAFEATNSALVAIALSLLAGLLVGFVNGMLVTGVGIPSIVATLGMQFLVRGLGNVLSNGVGITVVLDESHSFGVFAGKVGTIPVQSVWFLGIAVIFYVLLFRHKFGEHVLFVGDNQEAARMIGVDVKRTKTLVFMLIAVMAAFVGILSCYQMRSWWPTMGEGTMMMVFASVFVGGTSMFGGDASIEGTFIGSFIIGALEAGIIAAGLSGFWTQFMIGLLIIASVTVHTLVMRMRRIRVHAKE